MDYKQVETLVFIGFSNKLVPLKLRNPMVSVNLPCNFPKPKN